MHYPPEEKCMICHATIMTDSPAIKKLAEYAAQKKPVPWVPIYVVPDYVYFSHRTHINKAKLDCEACHGPVRERDVFTKEKPTSMAACISCHKEKGAPKPAAALATIRFDAGGRGSFQSSVFSCQLSMTLAPFGGRMQNQDSAHERVAKVVHRSAEVLSPPVFLWIRIFWL